MLLHMKKFTLIVACLLLAVALPATSALAARRMNNLVTELLNVSADHLQADQTLTFANPRDGWCYFTITGQAAIRLDDEASPLLDVKAGASAEAMRRLSAGNHVLHCAGQPTQLIVRAVPELQYAFFNSGDAWNFINGRDDNWAFVSKYLLPSTNVIISPVDAQSEHFQECLERWTHLGRRWLTTMENPYQGRKDVSADEAYAYWSKGYGLQNPLMDGIIVDEFPWGSEPKWENFAKAVQRIYANPKFKGKTFSPYSYGHTLVAAGPSRDFARACIDGGGYMCIERYLAEQPTRQEAEKYIHEGLVSGWNPPRFEQDLKGITRHTIVALADMSALGESLDVRPDVDFKVFTDMQMQALANDPAFAGLGGIQEYHSGYADEETVRWVCRLYRHYAIEGKTNLLSDELGYGYKLDYIANPDFATGLQDWTLQPAAADSIRCGHYNDFGFLEFRFKAGHTGDHFLIMKRSAKKPNVITQQIKNLKPGQLYSLKLVDGDYQDLVNGVSKDKMLGLSVAIDNVQILPGADHSFDRIIHSHYDHPVGPFRGRQHSYFMNFHWRVFRAVADTATLRISDWKSATDSGGPAGQELLMNFVEIQPYFAE